VTSHDTGLRARRATATVTREPTVTSRRPSRNNHLTATPVPVKASAPGVVEVAPGADDPVDDAVVGAGLFETGGGADEVDDPEGGAAPVVGAPPAGELGAVVVVVVVAGATVATKKPLMSFPVTCPGAVSLTKV
jgi:hypothetical protein